MKGSGKAETIGVHVRLTEREMAEGIENAGEPGWRPKTRGDCRKVPRPCPFVGCRHNLFCDVSGSGGLRFTHGVESDPLEVEPEKSCSLDALDLAGDRLSMVEVAELLNVTKQRVQQIEAAGVRKARDELRKVDADDGAWRPPERRRSFDELLPDTSGFGGGGYAPQPRATPQLRSVSRGTKADEAA